MKKLIALLLVAVMCLSFVACDESGNTETPPSDENNGSNLEKIERGTVTTSDNTLLPILFQALSEKGYNYTFNEDGTCSDTEYWWIEEDNEKSMLIFIATEYKWKYKIFIERKVNENNVDLAWISIDLPDYIGDSFLGFWSPRQPFNVQIESSEDSFICQEWREIASGGTLIFDKDGNMHREGETYKYEYDKELELISVFYHQTINMNVVFEEDTYKLKVAKEVYVPSTEYERFHSAYVTEKLASLTEGKTELVIGNTYTTASGKSFIFMDAGLIGNNIETECGFALYLDQYGVSFDTVEYSSPSCNGLFGFGEQYYFHKENMICYGGGFNFTKAELEADRNEFGILSFTIDGTAFYVSVDTFFE